MLPLLAAVACQVLLTSALMHIVMGAPWDEIATVSIPVALGFGAALALLPLIGRVIDRRVGLI